MTDFRYSGGEFFCGCVEEHSQRQGHLEESRVDVTLSHVRRGRGREKGERGTRYSSQQTQRYKKGG